MPAWIAFVRMWPAAPPSRMYPNVIPTVSSSAATCGSPSACCSTTVTPTTMSTRNVIWSRLSTAK